MGTGSLWPWSGPGHCGGGQAPVHVVGVLTKEGCGRRCTGRAPGGTGVTLPPAEELPGAAEEPRTGSPHLTPDPRPRPGGRCTSVGEATACGTSQQPELTRPAGHEEKIGLAPQPSGNRGPGWCTHPHLRGPQGLPGTQGASFRWPLSGFRGANGQTLPETTLYIYIL